MKKLAEISARILLKTNVIEKEQLEIYVYGFQVLYSNLFIGFSTFVWSVLLQTKMEWLIFISYFFILRLFVGGYHSPTFRKCFVLSNFLFLAVIFISDFSVLEYLPEWVFVICYVFAIAYIDYKMPKRARAEGVSCKKICEKRKQGRIVLGFQIGGIVWLGCSRNLSRLYINCAMIATVLVAIMMINFKKNRRKEDGTYVKSSGKGG